jgi:hypothetical protein
MICENIGGAKQDLNEVRPKTDLSTADILKKGFEDVSEAHEGLKPEGARAPFHRVNRPEHCVHQLRLGVPGVDLQKPRLKVSQQLVTFLEERELDFLKFVHWLRPPPCG